MSGPAYFTRSKTKMMLKETKPQSDISLDKIPHQMVYKILYKMPCRELIRMRKTCRYINNTVEDNKEAFSKRIDLGVNLNVILRVENGKPELFISSKQKRRISLDTQFENYFSGVSFRVLFLVKDGVIRDDQGMVATFLERLKMHCDVVFFQCQFPLQYMVRLADLVESRETRINTVSVNRQENLLSTLVTARRKSTFVLTLGDPHSLVLEGLEILMHFKRVEAYPQFEENDILLLLKALANLKDVGTLEKLSIAFPYKDPCNSAQSIWPLTQILWKKVVIPEKDPLKATSLRKQEYDYVRFQVRPHYILKLEMAEGKCAVIVMNSVGAHFWFISNTPEEILKIVLDNLFTIRFGSAQRKKYLSASKEEQLEILRALI